MKAICIDFICPNCSSIYEIFMRKSPQLMMFDCPGCKQFLTIYDGNVLKFNETILAKIKNIKSESDIEAIFSHIDQEIKINTRPNITKDDIVDFSIHLHNCNNFDDVMDLICKS